MNFWPHILAHLQAGKHVGLLYVHHSEGSSPGRQGFRQFVTEDGEMKGSIGGGMMEQKLVELSKELLKKHETKCFIRQQVHKTNIEKNRSGMICSGEQTIGFYFLDPSHITIINELISALQERKDLVLELTENGIALQKKNWLDTKYMFDQKSESAWCYKEMINFQNTIFIIGGGHVSLALSRTMNQLGFHVEVFDDRNELNTFVKNEYAHTKRLVDYGDVGTYIPEGNSIYTVLMTIGFRTDGLVLRQLLKKDLAYLGMLGSQEKVRKLFEDLHAEGFTTEQLSAVHAPVGIHIHSRTPEEIAISIAAHIIMIKNAR